MHINSKVRTAVVEIKGDKKIQHQINMGEHGYPKMPVHDPFVAQQLRALRDAKLMSFAAKLPGDKGYISRADQKSGKTEPKEGGDDVRGGDSESSETGTSGAPDSGTGGVPDKDEDTGAARSKVSERRNRSRDKTS